MIDTKLGDYLGDNRHACPRTLADHSALADLGA